MRRFTLASYKMITVDYNQFDKQTEVFFPLQYTPSKFSKQMNLFDYLCEYIFYGKQICQNEKFLLTL